MQRLSNSIASRCLRRPSSYTTPIHTPAHTPSIASRIASTSVRRVTVSTTASYPAASTSSPSSPPPPISTLRIIAYSTLLLATGFVMASAPVVEIVSGLITPPSDEETLSLFKPASATAAAIEAHIQTHPLAEALRANPKYAESRPHLKLPAAWRERSLTSGILMGDDKIAVPPLVFQDRTSPLPSLVSINHLGSTLCGFPGLIHGGLLATLLDEGLARACFPALPNQVGVTANLQISYCRPCPADSYVVLRAETTKVDGRKVWVKGWIEALGDGVEPGEKLVEAEALFVEPRGAAGMPKIG